MSKLLKQEHRVAALRRVSQEPPALLAPIAKRFRLAPRLGPSFALAASLLAALPLVSLTLRRPPARATIPVATDPSLAPMSKDWRPPTAVAQSVPDVLFPKEISRTARMDQAMKAAQQVLTLMDASMRKAAQAYAAKSAPSDQAAWLRQNLRS